MRVRRSMRGEKGAGRSLWRQAKRLRDRVTRGVARIPLRGRLTLLSLSVLLCLMVALGALISYYEERAMLENQAVALRNEARLAVSAARQAGLPVGLVPPGDEPPPAGALPLDIGVGVAFFTTRLAGTATDVAFFTPDGVLVANSDRIPQAPPSALASMGAVRQAATQPYDTSTYLLVTDATNQRQLAALLPIVAEGRTVMVLQIATPTAPIDRAVAETRWMLFLGILGALGIGAVLLPLIVRTALRPLTMIERTTTRISAGELSLRLEEPPTRDEIGRLARAFNHMVARLEAAFARQKRFVADVSHELRTPLTALGGGMEMLLIGAEAGDAETSRRLMRGMYAEVERMRRLVEDLLTLTRLDEGRMRLRLSRIDTGALVSGVCEQARQLAHGQEVTCDVAPELPAIQADADRLRQVLLNVVDNALKFTPAPGRVTVRAWQEEGAVAIAVEDTGVGIPSEALPHVFERFYRADWARVRAPGQVGGSGLGLAIARSLVTLCGGHIAISSEEGHGTCVTVRFPVAAGEARVTPALDSALAAGGESHSRS